MKNFKLILLILILSCTNLFSFEFTVSSYNAGGLSDHYDYLRAASMQKLMQDRYNAEPQEMALVDKIQRLALKILFSKNIHEKNLAQVEWILKGYAIIFPYLTQTPTALNSPNTVWNQTSEEMITTYKVRPIIIHDEKVTQMLKEHLQDITHSNAEDIAALLQEGRSLMAKRLFRDKLTYDIICLQEANYLNASLFPENYTVLFSKTASVNGIAWNKQRFELIKTIKNVSRAFVVQLLDKESGKTILVASAHLTGSNPFVQVIDPSTKKSDSEKGDSELKTLLRVFQTQKADVKIIGMDSNVTSLHPRLNILKEADFTLDYENYLEPTNTNPYQVLNTRIDWIALKTDDKSVSITNIPVLNVGLNDLQTNLSDHKPIAAKIKY